jgi:hypothetical protein
VTRRGAEEPEIYRITGARSPHSQDLDRRINRYLISMAIRTACVILVFVFPSPIRWVFAAGAVFLPYVAVLFANAADKRRGTTDIAPIDHRGLAGGAGPTPSTGQARQRPAAEGRKRTPSGASSPGPGAGSPGAADRTAGEALEGVLVPPPTAGSGADRRHPPARGPEG